MDIQKQFFDFYQHHLKTVAKAIEKGGTLIFIGIDSIGKTEFAEQILSEKFKYTYFPKKNNYLVFLSFKDKYSPTPAQLYKYWLSQTAELLHYRLDKNTEWNDFTFYSELSEFIKNLTPYERLVYVILDAQQLLSQNEFFFRNLIYLERYSKNKLSFILLSEPHILETTNPWARRFIQHFTNFKYYFLKTFNKKTILADIKRQEIIHKTSFKNISALILKHSSGLHGLISTYCYLLKDNPQIKSIRKLIKIVNKYDLFRYWVSNVLDSIPKKSLNILKEARGDKKYFKKYQKTIPGKWLIDLDFLKKDGTPRYPLMKPMLDEYSTGGYERSLRLRRVKHNFYILNEKLKLSKKEYVVLSILYGSIGKLITYDQIGTSLWPNQAEKFSLWAIAQIIRRLRKKLFLVPNSIKSIRGEGYILSFYE